MVGKHVFVNGFAVTWVSGLSGTLIILALAPLIGDVAGLVLGFLLATAFAGAYLSVIEATSPFVSGALGVALDFAGGLVLIALSSKTAEGLGLTLSLVLLCLPVGSLLGGIGASAGYHAYKRAFKAHPLQPVTLQLPSGAMVHGHEARASNGEGIFWTIVAATVAVGALINLGSDVAHLKNTGGISATALAVTLTLARQAKRTHPVNVSTEAVSSGRYSILLRPFEADEGGTTFSAFPWEVRMTRNLSKHTHIIAVGRPGERFAALGAARVYLEAAEWAVGVGRLAQEAQWVLLKIGTTPGVRQETDMITSSVRPERLVLLTTGGRKLWDAFRRDVWPRDWQLPDRLPRGNYAILFSEHRVPECLGSRSPLRATSEHRRALLEAARASDQARVRPGFLIVVLVILVLLVVLIVAGSR